MAIFLGCDQLSKLDQGEKANYIIVCLSTGVVLCVMLVGLFGVWRGVNFRAHFAVSISNR